VAIECSSVVVADVRYRLYIESLITFLILASCFPQSGTYRVQCNSSAVLSSLGTAA
jgi:hypothetical protein